LVFSIYFGLKLEKKSSCLQSLKFGGRYYNNDNNASYGNIEDRQHKLDNSISDIREISKIVEKQIPKTSSG